MCLLLLICPKCDFTTKIGIVCILSGHKKTLQTISIGDILIAVNVVDSRIYNIMFHVKSPASPNESRTMVSHQMEHSGTT